MSWPWLKDAKILDQQPTMPEEDKRYGRPVVAELMVEHAKSIAELRSVIQDDPLYEPTKHDDLWLLRFLLSHKGKVPKAAKACQHTLVFRKSHNLDASDVRFQPPSLSHPRMKAFLAYGDSNTFGVHLPDPSRGVITYINLAGMDQHGLIANVADEDVESFFICITEWCHQWLDYVTRTTGLLTKSIRILDVKGLTLSKINRACLKRNARYVNAMEDCYPQLLQSVFPCHSMALLQTFWTTFRPILPTRLVSKIDFIDPEHRRKDVDKLLLHIDEEHLPERFGGKNKAWPILAAL